MGEVEECTTNGIGCEYKIKHIIQAVYFARCMHSLVVNTASCTLSRGLNLPSVM